MALFPPGVYRQSEENRIIMKAIKYIPILIAFLAMCSCVRETLEYETAPSATGSDRAVTITATVDPSTKTSYENGKVFSWNPGDAIGVVVRNGAGRYTQVRFSTDEGGQSAEFTGYLTEGDVLTGVATYPFREDGEGNDLVLSSGTNGSLFRLSGNVHNTTGDQMADIPLVGNDGNGNGNYEFKTAVGILKVNFTGLDGDFFDRVTLESEASLSGDYLVGPDGGLVRESDSPATITRKIEGVQEEDSFLFFLPPGIIPSGMKVSLLDANGDTIHSITSKQPIEVVRNAVVSLAAIAVPEEALKNGTDLIPVSLVADNGIAGTVVRKGDEGGLFTCFTRDADLSAVTLTYSTDGMRVTSGGEEVPSGSVLNMQSPVTLTVEARGGQTKDYTITAFPSELPVVFIDTPNATPITSKKEWLEGGSITIWTTDSNVASLGTTKIKGRGNSTWYYPPKKPYNIKLDKKASILGMPKDKSWCLLANFLERTKLRNWVGFSLAAKTKLDWTPRGQFVELVLNGQHNGFYYLCEKIKVSKDRINIKEMKATDTDESSITGGYILEFDTNYDEVNKFKTDIRELPVMIKEPDENVLVPEQFNYIQSFINNVEATLAAGEPYDGLIDIDSFIDVWMVKELVYNTEMRLPRSIYYYKDRGGPLKAGPVWDFDLDAFRMSWIFLHKDQAVWYPYLFEYPEFVQRAKEKWNENKDGFMEVINSINDMHEAIRFAEARDATMWVLDNSYPYKRDVDLTFDEANEAMIQGLTDRWNWLDREINKL